MAWGRARLGQVVVGVVEGLPRGRVNASHCFCMGDRSFGGVMGEAAGNPREKLAREFGRPQSTMNSVSFV